MHSHDLSDDVRTRWIVIIAFAPYLSRCSSMKKVPILEKVCSLGSIIRLEQASMDSLCFVLYFSAGK